MAIGMIVRVAFRLICVLTLNSLLTGADNVPWDATAASINLLIKQYSQDGFSLSLSEFEVLLKDLKIGQVLENGSSTNDLVTTEQVNCSNSDVGSEANNFCNITSQCLSPSKLVELVNPVSSVSLENVDRKSLEKLCPIMIAQISQKSCIGNNNNETDYHSNHRGKPTPLEVWGLGMFSVTLISLCSLVGVTVIPVMGKKIYNRLLTLLVGLAVGSLLGSAVFHLIPQAFDLIDDTDESQNYLWISLVIMGGVYLFFMTERILKIILDCKKRNRLKYLSHASSDSESLRCMPSTISDEFHRSVGDLNSSSANRKQSYPSPAANGNETTSNGQTNSVGACANNHHKQTTGPKHEHHIEFKQGKDSAIATVAWMIIFGDGLHNFIDGLTIGAAFNENVLTGLSVSVAVFCEEFPHELGDFAVLLKAGMTIKQALMYNFLSACTCYLGLIVGILLGELTEASTYIFALAGGMFLYISLVDMIPEMNEQAESANQESVVQGLKVLLVQNIGWLTGVFTLFILAYYNKEMSFV